MPIGLAANSRIHTSILRVFAKLARYPSGARSEARATQEIHWDSSPSLRFGLRRQLILQRALRNQIRNLMRVRFRNQECYRSRLLPPVGLVLGFTIRIESRPSKA